MNAFSFVFTIAALLPVASAQDAGIIERKDVLYAEPASPLHTLDVYASSSAKNAPLVFWIHGGGWQGGDKSDVAEKPQFFVEKGFVFVSVNYRLLPKVEMIDIFHDVAKSFRWMHEHIAEYGGNPKRVLVGGHSAGAQLAALICTDDRYLKAEGITFTDLIGCVPDTSAQAFRLGTVLKEAGVKTTVFGAKETNHSKLNDNLGVAGDPATKVLLEFVEAQRK
jgi:acetyl esterase/lipase